MDRDRRPLLWALATYAAWVSATYSLEGLPRTLLRPEAEQLRAAYAVLANLLIGVGGSVLVLARVLRQHTARPAAAGISPPRRAVVMAFVGLAAGAAVYGLQSPPPRALTALVNGFTQVLPVSAAEVLVCWAVPSIVAAVCRVRSPTRARLVAIVPGSILFGLYHIAHSPPFNTPSMILFLTAVGVVTGVFFFVFGDLWATILFHNFVALRGVLDAVEASPGLTRHSDIQAPLVALALLTLLAVGAVHRWLWRSSRDR